MAAGSGTPRWVRVLRVLSVVLSAAAYLRIQVRALGNVVTAAARRLVGRRLDIGGRMRLAGRP